MELWAVIADPLAQRGMRQLAGELDNVGRCVVVDSAAAVTGDPDVVVTVGQSPTAMRMLAARWATVALIPDADPDQARAALRAGARAVVSTSAEAEEVRTAIRVARAGGGYLCRSSSTRLRRQKATLPARPLARRERETLNFIAEGLTHAQTARMLGVAESTVHSYVSRLRGKLTAGNTADLTRHALVLRQSRPPAHDQPSRPDLPAGATHRHRPSHLAPTPPPAPPGGTEPAASPPRPRPAPAVTGRPC
ncbi:hypothetical protein Asp14428_74890 [Actinoplanes sp. NBRC 14428]|nr:hypothetical protein Asp14428_74890 [Actinoplanes sp. NBRC 14428]